MVYVEEHIVKERAIMAKSEVHEMKLQTRNFRINQQQWILLQAFGSNLEDFSHFQISIIGFPFSVSCVAWRIWDVDMYMHVDIDR